MRFGIDISEHQDGLSLVHAAREEISFAVLRTTDGTYQDRTFASHLDDAHAAGLDVETYHYLRNPSEGTSVGEQVDAALEVLGETRAPMWLDCETAAGLSLNHITLAHTLFTSADVPVAGIYTSRRWWRWRMWGAAIRPFGSLWIADYGVNPTGAPAQAYPGDSAWPAGAGNQEPVMWQFSSRGRLTGFAGDVDLNARR